MVSGKLDWRNIMLNYIYCLFLNQFSHIQQVFSHQQAKLRLNDIQLKSSPRALNGELTVEEAQDPIWKLISLTDVHHTAVVGIHFGIRRSWYVICLEGRVRLKSDPSLGL